MTRWYSRALRVFSRIQRVAATVFIWHVVLNCAFASFVMGMPLALLVPRRLDPQRELPHRVGVFWWGRMVWLLNPFIKLEIEGAERLREDGPYLICSNHQSLLDVLVIMALEGDFKWVSGLRFFKIPLFSWYMRVTGYMAVDLRNPFGAGAILAECGEWIGRGVSVGLFPEGTRSEDGEVGPFKAGAFRVAVDKQVPVLPIAIDGTRQILPKGSWTYLGDTPFTTIRVRVLDPIHLSDLSEPSPVALSRACREAVAAQLEEWRADGSTKRDRGRKIGQNKRISISRV
jgi:1-acyl-sn-glycerol-3-phosphate acyltransferase